MKYKPLNDRLLVLRSERPQETQSGIIMASQKKQELLPYGKVIAIGADVHDIAVGDIVAFHTHTPRIQVLDLDGEEKQYLVFERSEILALVE